MNTTTKDPKDIIPFYMVHKLGGSSPSKAHATYAEAREEAERLAHKQPGCTFYVLIAAGMVTSRVNVEYTHFNFR